MSIRTEDVDTEIGSMTIEQVVKYVRDRDYLLPVFQRRFVWKEKQITSLFDSIMQKFPIGSFLFWQVLQKDIEKYPFYKFVSKFKKGETVDDPTEIKEKNEITAVLDGQQRISAFYVGLAGSYKEKFLHLNLLEPIGVLKKHKFKVKHQIEFITEEEGEHRNKTHGKGFWYLMSRILDSNSDVTLIKELGLELENLNLLPGQIDDAQKKLNVLYKRIHNDDIIRYHKTKKQDLDLALQVFIRTNTGGTQLSYADLLLSTLTTEWQKKDARKEIHSFVKELGSDYAYDGKSRFDFDKEFVLKTCLMLIASDNDIEFNKVASFKPENMRRIEEKWEQIKVATKDVIRLIANHGYSKRTLTANYAIIPIAYYLFSKGLSVNAFESSAEGRKNKENILTWLRSSLIQGVFGGSTDTTLRDIRKIIAEYEGKEFPYDKILKEWGGTRLALAFSDESIRRLLMKTNFKDPDCFSILSLLYPDEVRPDSELHKDHIFPQSLFREQELQKYDISEKKIKDFIKQKDNIANLQLLSKDKHRSKKTTLPYKWIEDNYSGKKRTEYMDNNFIPSRKDLRSPSNFDKFLIARTNLMVKKLSKILRSKK